MGNRIVKYILTHASEFLQEKISISFYVIGELLPYFWTSLVKCKKKETSLNFFSSRRNTIMAKSVIMRTTTATKSSMCYCNFCIISWFSPELIASCFCLISVQPFLILIVGNKRQEGVWTIAQTNLNIIYL